MVSHRIALIPGDGIGVEVMHSAVEVIDEVGKIAGFTPIWKEYDWGSERYLSTGQMMPDDALEQLRNYDAILLGAVGDPRVADHVSLWGLLIPIRRSFQQYVNLRPVRKLGTGTGTPGDPALDIIVVRENTEGEYSNVGGEHVLPSGQRLAFQQAVFSEEGVARVAKYALNLAQQRESRLVSATKSNGITCTMPFWDDVVEAVREESYPSVPVQSEHIDALCAHLVLRPSSFDVIVASNLFGDILSDLSAALAGSIGVAPSANLNPEREFPSMFEPVHGSAPDIAGQGTANPTGMVWSAAMMLEHLGLIQESQWVIAALDRVYDDGTVTPDMGGQATTAEMTEAIVRTVIELSEPPDDARNT